MKWTQSKNNPEAVVEDGPQEGSVVCFVKDPLYLAMLVNVPRIVDSLRNVIKSFQMKELTKEDCTIIDDAYELLKVYVPLLDEGGRLSPMMLGMLNHIVDMMAKQQNVTAHSLASHPQWAREFTQAQFEGWVNIRAIPVTNSGTTTEIEVVGITPSGRAVLSISPKLASESKDKQ